jgi:hypothetical protein
MRNRNRFVFNLFLILVILTTACGVVTDVATEVIPSQPPGPTALPGVPTAVVLPTSTAVPSELKDTWLVMLYENADDEVLEEDMVIDVNEAELVGSSDKVTILAQLDRYEGGYDGHGNETSTKRYLITQDGDLNYVGSQELDDLGELDMGDPNTLVDFATWAMQTYPAEHYVLILSDHGGGWTGGWSDDTPNEGSGFTMQNIDDALGAILANTGVGAFDLVGFDACLMGQLEVMSAIAPHAFYGVGSEETEPSLGWAYGSFLQELVNNPAMSAEDLARSIVSTYIAQDIRITDSASRSLLYGDSSVTASQAAEDFGRNVTLSAFDLTTMQNVNAAFNEFIVALANADQGAVAEARAYAQAYETVFDEDLPAPFIDMGHFIDLLVEISGDPGVSDAAQQLKNAISSAVVAEMHGPERPGSTGMSFYFPNSDLYDYTFIGDGPAYTAYVGRFAAASLWDDYLTYHYTGDPINPDSADLAVLTPAESGETDFTEAVAESAPEAGAELVVPGGGEIVIDPLVLSATEITVNDPVTISTTITGDNVGYVYYFITYYDESSDSYLMADMGYISAETTLESGGLYYPDWGAGPITIDFEWDPTLYYMSDGIEGNDQFAYFEPTFYGVDIESDVYSVRGVYTFVDSGTEMYAVMDFDGNGNFLAVYGFENEDGTGTSHQITPQYGDTFTIYEEWLEFENNPEGEFVDYLGGTMTFGDTPFFWKPYYVYTGYYILGIAVSDINGNYYYQFAELTITE